MKAFEQASPLRELFKVEKSGLKILQMLLYNHLINDISLEAGSSWRTIKMSMPDNSDLRQIIMAFCMVSKTTLLR